MKGYWCRPDEMFHIGDYYYPEGCPPNSSAAQNKVEFIDKNGKTFYICYSKEQFDGHLTGNCGIFFPFIPLYVTGNL